MHWDVTLGGQENETEKSLAEKKGLVWMVVRESMFLTHVQIKNILPREEATFRSV